MARAPDQLVDANVQLLMRMMRVGADRAVDIGKALGDGKHLGMPFDPRRDGDNACDAGRLRTRNHGIELAGEIGKIEMAMTVDEHQLCPLLFAVNVTGKDWTWCRQQHPGGEPARPAKLVEKPFLGRDGE